MRYELPNLSSEAKLCVVFMVPLIEMRYLFFLWFVGMCYVQRWVIHMKIRYMLASKREYNSQVHAQIFFTALVCQGETFNRSWNEAY